jgi:hypothetical protein
VTTPIEAQYDPWGRSVLNALRRWIILPIALGLIGAAAGLVAGDAAKPSAEALLRVESAASDGTGMQIVQESTVLELDTAPIYTAAADETGTTAADLRARTQIAAVTDSQLITITVTAPTAEEAVAQANAIADTAIAVNEQRIDASLEEVTDNTRELITKSTLANADAEQARVSRLGDTLGQNQSNLVAGSRNLVLVHSAEGSALLPSPLLLGSLGLVAGVLLGAAIAILLGARRGTIQTGRELHRLYPNAAVVDSLDLESVIALEAENVSTVYIAGLSKDTEELQPVADAVRAQLLAGGRQLDTHEPHRAVVVAERSGHAQVVTTTLTDTVLRRVIRDTSALLIVPVRPKVTRLEQLDAFASRLNDRTYLLVEHGTPNWN